MCLCHWKIQGLNKTSVFLYLISVLEGHWNSHERKKTLSGFYTHISFKRRAVLIFQCMVRKAPPCPQYSGLLLQAFHAHHRKSGALTVSVEKTWRRKSKHSLQKGKWQTSVSGRLERSAAREAQSSHHIHYPTPSHTLQTMYPGSNKLNSQAWHCRYQAPI